MDEALWQQPTRERTCEPEYRRPVKSGLFAVVLLGACGDNHKGLPLDEVDQAREDAECSRLVRCGLFEDATTCTTYFRPRAQDSRNAAVAAGSLRYNGVAAERCFAWIEGSSCDATSSSARVAPRECDQIFVGNAAGGGTCFMHSECESGVCDQPACARDTCCEGVCAPAQKRGAAASACTDDQDCTPGTYCNSDKSCHALEAAGQPCLQDAQCGYQLACVGAGIDPGTCRPLPLLGDACPYLRCAEIGALCNAAQLCVPSGPGAPCSSDAQCSFYGLCDPAREICGPVPTLGQSCSTRCAGESWCDRGGSSPVCAAPLGAMADCTTDESCESRLCEEGPIFDFCAAEPLCYEARL